MTLSPAAGQERGTAIGPKRAALGAVTNQMSGRTGEAAMSRITLERLQSTRPLNPYGQGTDKQKTVDLDLLAQWMDSAIKIPGVGVRFGLDAILGLIPGIGDAAAAAVSLYIIRRAHQLGVGRATLLRMSLNVAGDMMLGAIPVAGDVIDVFWKANQRTVALLRRHAVATPPEARKMRLTDRHFVGVVILLVGALAIGSVAAAYYLLTWSVSFSRQLFD